MDPEQESQSAGQSHLTESYEDDLAHAMNVTDASEVQNLLADAREKEARVAVEAEERDDQKWYSRSSMLLLVLTVAILGYAAYYYVHLTVKVQPSSSVGVFQNSNSVPYQSTTLQQVLATYTNDETLPLNKPTLINLVNDTQSNSLITNAQLFTFIGAAVPEPLQQTITAARLGVVRAADGTYPFIVASVADPALASKEFGLAEPQLLTLFASALNIDAATVKANATSTFQSQYFNNIPVRVIVNSADGSIVYMYGYVSNNVVVITSKPEVMKAVYDSVINQQ